MISSSLDMVIVGDVIAIDVIVPPGGGCPGIIGRTGGGGGDGQVISAVTGMLVVYSLYPLLDLGNPITLLTLSDITIALSIPYKDSSLLSFGTTLGFDLVWVDVCPNDPFSSGIS